MEWGSNLQELVVSAVGIGLRPVGVVLFAGVGFLCAMVGAMATEIGIPFAGVQVLCGGASGVASEVGIVCWSRSYVLCHWLYNQYKWGAV